MTKFSNPIPAILVHNEDGVEYRIRGKITAINESANTVSMKINGRAEIEHGIPMESIYLTEGILDSIKKAGRAIAKGVEYLLRKIKGFLLPINESGEIDYTAINVPINIGAMEARGELPTGVHFFPNAEVTAEAEENGMPMANTEYDDPTVYMAEAETVGMERYWTRVMKAYVANESFTVSDAVKAVNEGYVKRYKSRHKLNEAVVSLHNPNWDRDSYGPERTAGELVAIAKTNILAQLKRGIGDPHVTQPLLVWGAPGIGKTVILQSLCRELKEDEGLNLMFQTVQCSSLNLEDWGIPAIMKKFKPLDKQDGVNDKGIKGALQQATNVPKTWLPVYELTGDDEEDARRDALYNSGQFRGTGEANYDGGIIFFDELSRLPGKAKNNMMALVDQYMYEDMHMASKWCLMFASNRYEDVRFAEENEFVWEAAQADRFHHITYVPDKAEWLEWARRTNAATGRQNLDERFCAFIEQSADGVWYDALDFGSRDNVLEPSEKTAIQNYDNPDEVRSVLTDNPKLKGQLGWTGRKWVSGIGRMQDETLANIFRNHPELLKSIYNKDGKNINQQYLSNALDMLSPTEWMRWAKPYVRRIDPAGRMNRISFFNAYIDEYIMRETFGENALPNTEWKIYNEYKSVFTPDVVASIWETGAMPNKKMQEDDDKFYAQAGNYASTEISKWKKDHHLASEVMSIIFNGYPGGITTMAKQIVAEDQFANNTTMLPPATAQKLLKKFTDMFTITVGKDKIPTLFNNPNTNVSDPDINAVLITLENSKFARNVAHAASYAVKIAIQQSNDSVLKLVTDDYLGWTTGDFVLQLENKYKNAYEALTHLTDIIQVSNDKKKQNSIIMRTLLAPAQLILMYGRGRNMDFMKNGKY